MSHDSAAIDNAIIAKLGADATLLSYCPNGIYMDEAPQGMTRFVIVSLVEESDEPVFGSRAFEDALYLIEARLVSSTANANGNCKLAAARIDVLLDDQQLLIGSPPMPVAGYTWMAMHRESRIRLTEVDEIDPSIRWFRRGGHYRVVMDVNP